MEFRSFYHSELNGPEAESLLLTRGENGSYLLRPSKSNPGCFVLSVRNENRVSSVKIQNEGDYYDLFGGEHFASLTELVKYCISKPETLKEKDGTVIKLGKPFYSDNPTTERYFHANLTGKRAQEMQENKNVQNGTYLLRCSNSKPGDIVISYKIREEAKHILIYCKDKKFGVGDGQWFDTLQELISSDLQAYLKQPLNRTIFRVSDIKRRIAELETESANQRTGKSGFGEEFDMLHHLESMNQYSRYEGCKEHNKPKNRYKNILPFDYTRIILKDNPEEAGDYINANYIMADKIVEYRSDKLKKTFIATQGCLENTVVDFWRMVWQENSRVIVMTTNKVERGKKKCAQYWPDNENEKTFDYLGGKLVIRLKEERKHQCYVLREFSAELLGTQGQLREKRPLYQFHFTIWPDHGVPNDPSPAVEFLHDINKKQKSIRGAGPVIVHCSAGIGRTGTFIVIDIILEMIEKYGLDIEIDIQKIVEIIRSQRSGMVQTEAQYKFIYEAVAKHVEDVLERNSKRTYENAKFASVKPEPKKRVSKPKKEEERSMYENIGNVLQH